MSADDIAVLYIARGGEGALENVQRFVSSYRARRAGQAHTLHVIAKNWRSESDLKKMQSLFEATPHELLPLPDDGFDLGAYFRAAKIVCATWLLCLNTHSEILADDWVKLLIEGARAPGVGAAGATGSWESHTTSLLRMSKPAKVIPRFQRFVELCWFRYHFRRFPNAHLRTNAFMIRRSDLLEYAVKTRVPSSKEKAWVVESGRSGVTGYLRQKGLRVVVCGADGAAFLMNEWPLSQTYCAGHQSNLLIGDNRTRRYKDADKRHRAGLQLTVWGRVDDSVL